MNIETSNSVVITISNIELASNWLKMFESIVDDALYTTFGVTYIDEKRIKEFNHTVREISILNAEHIRQMFKDGATSALLGPEAMKAIEKAETRTVIVTRYQSDEVILRLHNNDICF